MSVVQQRNLTDFHASTVLSPKNPQEVPRTKLLRPVSHADMIRSKFYPCQIITQSAMRGTLGYFSIQGETGWQF